MLRRGKNDAVWFGTVLAFFTFRGPIGKLGPSVYVLSPSGEKVALGVYVKWYEQVNHSKRTEHLGWPRLKQAKDERVLATGGVEKVDWTDIIAAKEIIKPVLLQRDPTKRGRWFYNPYVV